MKQKLGNDEEEEEEAGGHTTTTASAHKHASCRRRSESLPAHSINQHRCRAPANGPRPITRRGRTVSQPQTEELLAQAPRQGQV